MSLPRVYISVLNWNGYKQTIRCLHSLEHLNYSNYQVIVVDNHSHDDSVNRIRTAFPNVRMLCADTNRGYAGGNELALKETLADSQGELFWILNNDAVVRSDTLTALVDSFHRHGEAVYGSILLTRENENVSWGAWFQYWEIAKGRRYIQRKIRNLPPEQCFDSMEDHIVGNVSGASLLIPTSIIRKHGFIDTSFFMYMEDADYCFRLRELGIRSVFVPRSIVYHAPGGSRRDQAGVKPIILYYQTRNRLIFQRKYISYPVYFVEIFKHCFYAVGWCLSFLMGNKQGFRSAYYTFSGILDAVLNHKGKRFAPEKGLKVEQP